MISTNQAFDLIIIGDNLNSDEEVMCVGWLSNDPTPPALVVGFWA
jgi:hypothetical protein